MRVWGWRSPWLKPELKRVRLGLVRLCLFILVENIHTKNCHTKKCPGIRTRVQWRGLSLCLSFVCGYHGDYEARRFTTLKHCTNSDLNRIRFISLTIAYCVLCKNIDKKPFHGWFLGPLGDVLMREKFLVILGRPLIGRWHPQTASIIHAHVELRTRVVWRPSIR